MYYVFYDFSKIIGKEKLSPLGLWWAFFKYRKYKNLQYKVFRDEKMADFFIESFYSIEME